MNTENAMIMALRRVLDSASQGMGAAQSLVREMRLGRGEGEQVARRVLLGNPIGAALQDVASGESEEVSMLATLVVLSSRGSVRLAGEKGRRLSAILERWVRTREAESMEKRVMRLRGYITSAVMGGLGAMVSNLAPILSSFQPTVSHTAAQVSLLPVVGALMVGFSSVMLGYFLSGRGFVSNALVATACYLAASALVSPLVSVQPSGLLGVK
jgi:hypothetical protein